MTLAQTMVGDLMSRHPATVKVFLRHRMACPGCLMAAFMTVAEAAVEHGVDETVLVAELDRAMAGGETPA